MSNMLSDDALRQAAAKLRDARLAMQPSPEECGHEFSPQFERAMDGLMRKGRRRAVWHGIAAVAASLFLVFLLGVATTLVVSQEARAAVVSWLREQYENSVVYRFWDSSDTEDLPKYQIGWLPDGFVLLQEIEEEQYLALYQSSYDGRSLVFTYSTGKTWGELVIWGDTDSSEQLTIQGLHGEYVLSEDGAEGDLIWIDDERQIVFTLSSSLGKDTMIEIAESIFRVN